MKMKRWTVCLLQRKGAVSTAGLLLSYGVTALGVDYSHAKQDPKDRYESAVNLLRKRPGTVSKILKEQRFTRFDWIQKTAIINEACRNSKKPVCYEALKVGLRDRALVVRDHALRLVLSEDSIPLDRKREVASSVVSDERNYRQGKPFWIVLNAQKFLSSMN